MLTQTEAVSLSDDMRALLASLLMAPEPLSIETAAVRAGMSLNTARSTSILLLTAGYAKRLKGEKSPLWIAEAKPDVLSEVAFHICKAYANVAERSNIWLKAAVQEKEKASAAA